MTSFKNKKFMEKNLDLSKTDKIVTDSPSRIYIAFFIFIACLCICGIIFLIRNCFQGCNKQKLNDDTKHLMLVNSDNSESF